MVAPFLPLLLLENATVKERFPKVPCGFFKPVNLSLGEGSVAVIRAAVHTSASVS